MPDLMLLQPLMRRFRGHSSKRQVARRCARMKHGVRALVSIATGHRYASQSIFQRDRELWQRSLPRLTPESVSSNNEELPMSSRAAKLCSIAALSGVLALAASAAIKAEST